MYYVKIITAMVFVALIGLGVGFAARDYNLKDQAINAKVAHYDTETGRFTWGSMIPQTSTDDLFAKAIEPPKEKIVVPAKKPDAKKKTATWSGVRKG